MRKVTMRKLSLDWALTQAQLVREISLETVTKDPSSQTMRKGPDWGRPYRGPQEAKKPHQRVEGEEAGRCPQDSHTGLYPKSIRPLRW